MGHDCVRDPPAPILNGRVEDACHGSGDPAITVHQAESDGRDRGPERPALKADGFETRRNQTWKKAAKGEFLVDRNGNHRRRGSKHKPGEHIPCEPSRVRRTWSLPVARINVDEENPVAWQFRYHVPF